MTTFEQIQELWGNQQNHKAGAPDEIIRKAEQGAKAIKTKHKVTIALLAVTVVLLLLYSIAFSSGLVNNALTGLVLMVTSILVRIAAEAISYRRFAAIDIKKSLQQFTQQTVLFYQFRKKILLLLTPLVLVLYTAGFLLLLPGAKQHVSRGFYIYIIVSGILFAIFICWLIAKQTKKEIQLLQFLTRVQQGLKGVKSIA
jgi:hypothetical protein